MIECGVFFWKCVVAVSLMYNTKFLFEYIDETASVKARYWRGICGIVLLSLFVFLMFNL